MRIPRSYVENYSRALNVVSEQARRKLVDALSGIDFSADAASVRDAVIAVMQPACGASSAMAARLAADFYDGLRERFGLSDGFSAEANALRLPEATDGAVRAFVQDLVDGKPVGQFVGKCADRIDHETRRAANECMAHNAKRDPKRPKWARVPTGMETCEFCIMLASRGFAYQSGKTASHAHPNCDCRVIPSWDEEGAAVEGYDVEYYKDCYEHPENHPEIREALNARRRELYAESSTARRAETKAKRSVSDASRLETPEGIAIRDSAKLQKSFKPETAAQLGVDVEDALLSGDRTRENAAKVFARTIEGDAKFRRVANISRAHYNPVRKEIEVPSRLDVPPKTIVHETLHLADRQGTVSHGLDGSLTTSTREYSSHSFTTGRGYIRTMLKDDWAEIETAAKDEGKDPHRYLKEKFAGMGLDETYEGRAFLSDFADAASDGQVQLGWAHTYKDPAYWKRNGGETIGTECLANYGGAAVCNEVEYRAIKQMFPRTAGVLDDLLEAMASDYQ